jgi:crossover junction endodeoxyribonuclease RuvC
VKVAGLDLALDETGVATEHGVHTIKSKPLPEDDKHDYTLRNARLNRIRQELAPLLRGHQLVVMEGPAYAAGTPGTWDRAGLWWDLYRSLHRGGFLVAVAPPANVKKYACGKGNAGKTAVIAAVTRLCPDVLVSNDNEADAQVLWLMGKDQVGDPQARVPAAHRTALAGCHWPVRFR